MSNEWIEHTGGGMPVSGDTMVLVRFRDGYVETCEDDGTSEASFWGSSAPGPNLWNHTGGYSDIIAYRVVT